MRFSEQRNPNKYDVRYDSVELYQTFLYQKIVWMKLWEFEHCGEPVNAIRLDSDMEFSWFFPDDTLVIPVTITEISYYI